MKRLFTCLVSVLLISGAFTQSPGKMSYQAVVRNSTNQMVINQTVGIKISILQGTVNGSAVYIETQTPTTNANGLVTLVIGGGTVISGTFSSIDWSVGPYFIKTETDPTGGISYTIEGTSQLVSVPYALFAERAGNTFSGNFNDLINAPDFSAWDTNRTDDVTLYEDQTIPGIKSFSGKVMVPEPNDSSDAVTKKYADDLLKALSLKGVIAMDYEGNIYSTVRIGSRIWMAENLKTHHYRDGEAIPIVLGDHNWGRATSAVCFENDYGGYYNWYAVESEKLCPTGWSVPSESSWQKLQDFLGGSLAAGPKLKAGTYGGGLESNNESGFTAVAAGVLTSGGFGDQVIGYMSSFWSSSSHDSISAVSVGLTGQTNAFLIGGGDKTVGRSVRCIKGYY